MTMKLSMWTSYYAEETPEDAVRLLKENGYDYCELSDEHAAAKLTLAFAPKYEPPRPPSIIMSAVSIISPMTPRDFPTVRVPSSAESITMPRYIGINISPITSIIMQSGPRMK